MTRRLPVSYDKTKSFKKLVEIIQKQAGGMLLEPEAETSARNLIGFCQTLLAIEQALIQSGNHDK